jgi:hypothetical protein
MEYSLKCFLQQRLAVLADFGVQFLGVLINHAAENNDERWRKARKLTPKLTWRIQEGLSINNFIDVIGAIIDLVNETYHHGLDAVPISKKSTRCGKKTHIGSREPSPNYH